MDNSGNMICKADIRIEVSLGYKIFLLLVGLFLITWIYPDGGTYGYSNIYDRYWTYEDWNIGFMISIVVFIILISPLVINGSNLKTCYLTLYDNRLKGYVKGMFSSKSLDLPIDKIDNIVIKEDIKNKFIGGRTVEVRSASSVMRFICVQNASEFVDASIAHIEKIKNNALLKSTTVEQSSGSNSSNAVKIKELKELLDSGLISQEEFESKRKELLAKI